jgi:hypothetical protein
MPPFPFLRLPLELRLQVYTSIAQDVPHHPSMTEFSGLVLSCRQIKSEFEKEYMRVYQMEVSNIAQSLIHEGIQITSVPTVFSMAQILPYSYRMILRRCVPFFGRSLSIWHQSLVFSSQLLLSRWAPDQERCFGYIRIVRCDARG